MNHLGVRLRLVWTALRRALVTLPVPRLEGHQDVLRRAVLMWRWHHAAARARRQARRLIRRSRQRWGPDLGLLASIASPIGMGNDGQRAYDMATRTWFGTLVGNLRGAGSPFFDPTNPSFLGGAKGDGITDDGPALRACLAAATAARGTMFIPPPPGGVAYLVTSSNSASEIFLITHAVQVIGCGWAAEIRIGSAIAGTIDIFRIAPTTVLFAPDVTMHKFEDFRLTAQSGTPARHAFNFDATAVSAFDRQFQVCRVWCDPFGGRAIVTTNPIPNANGAIFICVIEQSNLAGGVLLQQAGDSITIQDNIIYGPNIGIDAQLVAGAGQLVIERNNCTATGGAIIRAGISVRLIDNEFELAAAYTGPNNALVDMAGTPAVTALATSEVRGNVISVLAGAGNIDCLRVDTATDTAIDWNSLTQQNAGQHIRITANATRTRIGRHNAFIGAGGAYIAAAIANAGVMTTQQSDPLQYSEVADSAVISNTNAQTAFSKTFSIPALTLRAGDVLRIRAGGIYSTKAAAPGNITLAARLGGVIINSTTIGLLAAQANNDWRVHADLTVRIAGAGGTFVSRGDLVSILTATGIGSGIGSTAIDTTAAQLVDVVVTFTVADVANTITMQQLEVELLRAGTTS